MDSRWKDHLYSLDHLKEGISYRAYGQKDPLVEYKRESFMAFAQLMDTIKREVIIYLFRASGEILKSQLTGYQGEKVKPKANLPRIEKPEMVNCSDLKNAYPFWRPSRLTRLMQLTAVLKNR